MFDPGIDAIHSTWSSTSHGRGKRMVEIGEGCYVIEQIATGKVLVGTSKQVSKSVDQTIAEIRAGKFPNKAFMGACKLDGDLKLHEFSTTSRKASNALEKKIRESVYPRYLLLGV